MLGKVKFSSLLLLFTIGFLNCNYVNAEPEQSTETIGKELNSQDEVSFKDLYQKIYSGKATFSQVKLALSSASTTQLVNTMHALYAMKWHVGVYKLLYKMWRLEMDEDPAINWGKIQQAPVRIALASTINRIDILKSKELRDYIRSFKYDDLEANRGQVLVALGLNGDPIDVPYLVEMSDSNNRYLTQIGISSLAFMADSTAKNALITLAKKHQNTPRGKLILDVLSRAYNVDPITEEEALAEKIKEQENIIN